MKQPNLYIIAGCNGAGKTTASMTVLPEVLDCEEFVNADEIAKGLSPFSPRGNGDCGRKIDASTHRYIVSGKENVCNRNDLGNTLLQNIDP